MLLYLLKFSISVAVLYIFYRAVLRPLTFYQCNRFYLLGYSLLSFVIPCIDISSWLPGSNHPQLVNIIPAISYYNFTAEGHTDKFLLFQTFTASDWLLLTFCTGALFMLLKLMKQYISLRNVRRHAVLLDADTGVQLFETNAIVSPFSFGNAIYFNRNLHTEEELQRIIQHEFVHVKQNHTIDLLIAELVCIVNWFNPFAWLMRYSIRQNLEFIADNNVVANGLDKKAYQYLLLKVIGVPRYSIANNFNFSNLKKRIVMMNKIKTPKLHLTKFLFVLPLMAVLFLAFRKKDHENKTNPNAAGIKTLPADTIPKPPPVTSVDVSSAVSPQVLPDNVANISTTSNTDKKKGIHTYIAVVTLKNGNTEKYNLYDPKEKDAYIKKYGQLPNIVLPPAPPPAPPVEVLRFKETVTKPDPLYVIDGVEQKSKEDLKDLQPQKIKEINVLKGKDATDKYGDKGKNGVIEIATKTLVDKIDSIAQQGTKNDLNKTVPDKTENIPAKQPEISWSSPSIDKMKADSVMSMRVEDNTGFVEVTIKKNIIGYSPANSLIVLDGKALPDAAKINEYIRQEDIAYMTASKGKTAIDKYGNRAAAGLIEIYSKKVRNNQVQNTDAALANTEAVSMANLNISGTMTAKGSESLVDGNLSFATITDHMPLVLYNGKTITDIASFKLINTKFRLLSLDSKNSIAKYGSKAQYGALEINSL